MKTSPDACQARRRFGGQGRLIGIRGVMMSPRGFFLAHQAEEIFSTSNQGPVRKPVTRNVGYTSIKQG